MIEDNILINDLIDDFVNTVSDNSRSRNTYRNILGAYLSWLIKDSGAKDIHKIDVNVIRSFQIYLAGKGHSDYTIGSYLGTVKLFYRYLFENNIVKADFLRGFKISAKKTYFRKKPLTEKQITDLLAVIDKNTTIGKRDHAIINLLARMGLRCREVCALDVEDFFQEEGNNLVCIQRKGARFKDDIQHASEKVIKPIRDYWTQADIQPGSPAFQNHSYNLKNGSRRLDPKYINTIVKKYLRLIGINDPMITAHSLRHSCATVLLRHNVSIYDIKLLMGHKRIQTTERYVAYAEQELKKEGKALKAMDLIL
jgi:site-specific recombinase XerD